MRRFARSSAAIALLLVLTSSPAPGAEPAAEKSSELVAEIQRELHRLGYRPGTADGIPKESTRRAIRNFERVLGRSATGQASEALLAEIRTPCEVAFDERGYKKARGGCARPSQVADAPDIYLVRVGRGEVILKLEPLEADGL